MTVSRGVFSSRIGFIMAAAGSAVGLGNIWGFPTQTASNGGAAFLLMYLILAFFLAYPAFMAEILIGRYGQANAVTSLERVATTKIQKKMAVFVGLLGIMCASFILSFYGIVAGWMLAHTIEPVVIILNHEPIAKWLVDFSISRNMVFTAVFVFFTMLIIRKGVENGIEKWSKRLMPLMLIILVLLIIYVLTLDGAKEGLNAYLNPDFTRILEPQLLLSALGQAFFSLSLGSGVMIIYGSYISKTENVVSLGALVTCIDVGIAFLAGLLIIPAMYVAQAQGVEIFTSGGQLLSEDTLVFTVLPHLFNQMGGVGLLCGFGFFALMTVAALTSSISMLEAPVSYVVERFSIPRKKSSVIVSTFIFLLSCIIIYNFSTLFSFVITLSTQYSQPITAMLCCVFVGWIWQRDSLLTEIKQGYELVDKTLFWKIWPVYTKLVCPLAIMSVFFHSVF